MTDKPLASRKILYLVTEDWYFWSHRLPMARAARAAGADIVVACRVTNHGDRIRDEGFELVEIPFDRSGLNPVRDFGTVRHILSAYKTVRPDLVHHVALKPSLYGALAAWLAGVPAVINAMAGMGFMFISDSFKARLLRPAIKQAFSWFNNRRNTRVIVQNGDDARLFERDFGVKADHIRIIPGSGVDIEKFQPSPESSGMPVAVCISRMLWDKGIGELVEAARLLKKRGVALTIRLVGPTDANPASVSPDQLARWQQEGVVDVAGASDDVSGEYARAHIAVLPSYREGLPKSLLEAAACGRPMVATDVPGCREVCLDGRTGLLVPAQSVDALADALQRLASDPSLRQLFGAEARHLVETKLADHVIAGQTVDLYVELVGQGR